MTFSTDNWIESTAGGCVRPGQQRRNTTCYRLAQAGYFSLSTAVSVTIFNRNRPQRLCGLGTP